MFSPARDRARARRERLPRRRRAPPVRAADRAAQADDSEAWTRRVEGVDGARRTDAPVRLAGDHRGRTVRVLVTGATGFTGGHLARALARARRRRVGDGAGRANAGRFARPASEPSIGDLRDADIAAARRRRRRRRLQHRGAVPAGRPSRERLSPGQRRRGRDSSSRPPRRAGVRRVVHCSTVGVHGDIEHPPANEDAPLRPGRRLPGVEGRRGADRARRGRAHRRRGRDRASERHLRSGRSPAAEAVPRRRAAAVRHSRRRHASSTTSPTSTTSSKASACAARSRARRAAPTSSPARKCRR